MDANLEWCRCGHHDRQHDLESEETQPCSAPGCRCMVFRPTGEGMPDMVLLNEFGTGLDDDGNPIVGDDAESLLTAPVDEDVKEEAANGEENSGEADAGNEGEVEVAVFDEHGQEVTGAEDEPAGE